MTPEQLHKLGGILNTAIKMSPEFTTAAQDLSERIARLVAKAKLELPPALNQRFELLRAECPATAAHVMRNAEDELMLFALISATAGFLVNGDNLQTCGEEVARERVAMASTALSDLSMYLVENGQPVALTGGTPHSTTLQ